MMRGSILRQGTLGLLSAMIILVGACGSSGDEATSPALNDQQLEDLVRESYRYVAMFNVNNKFAIKQGGWNTVEADTALKDHTMREIARPNNDTLYIGCLLDLRGDAVVLEMPAFDSTYVSLMITGYDHYVNVPMATRLGDFAKPEKMLIYSARTDGYNGTPVDGIDRGFEATGDFVSAVLRVMPHASDPERFARIKDQMQSVQVTTLAEYLGNEPKPVADSEIPAVGATDADVFATNLLEVMQFVFNHTTFDADDPLDVAVLATYEPLGVAPGRAFDPAAVATIDGPAIREIAHRVAATERARALDPAFKEQALMGLFQPKGRMSLELLLLQSVIGPIGLPAAEAVYPAIATADGEPMNALHDYVIRMSPDEMPPHQAFWSVTLYDTVDGFFIPNDRDKYSVGENGGMKLNADGGITIYVAAEQPAGVPAENWLPIERKDLSIGPIMRIYVPEFTALKSWTAPVAERIGS
jgi:hypothetical protein